MSTNIRRLLGGLPYSVWLIPSLPMLLTVPVMLSISPRLTVVSLAVYPLMLVLVQMFSHRLRAQQLDVQERISRLSDLIQEDMSGISLIKIYAQGDNERAAFSTPQPQFVGSKPHPGQNPQYPVSSAGRAGQRG